MKWDNKEDRVQQIIEEKRRQRNSREYFIAARMWEKRGGVPEDYLPWDSELRPENQMVRDIVAIPAPLEASDGMGGVYDGRWLM